MADSPGQTETLPKLTAKQRQWVSWFLGGGDGSCRWNATAAAREAGYKFPNVEGPKNLVNPSIAAHIADTLASAGLTPEIVTALVVEDATKSDADILALAAKAPSVPATASAISAFVSARTTARTNLLKIHNILSDKVNIRHSGRVDHVHRNPDLKALTDDELAALEVMAQRVTPEAG